MTTYRIRALGDAAVERDGEPVDIPIGKPFGLLVMLALADEPVPRSSLARILWPESDPEHGRQSVRQALVAVRQALGEDVFIGEDPLWVDPARVTTDVAALRCALDAGRFEEAVALRKGGFLEGVAFSRARPFETWIEETRAELDRTLARALELEGVDRSGAGDCRAALKLLDAAVAIHPAVSIQMARADCLLSMGELAEARAALARLELATLTDGEAERYTGLRDRLHALAGQADGPEPEHELVQELVGRAEELAVLTGLWRSASSGSLRVAELTGPPGIGKTRLARELARMVVGAGQGVWVTAYAAEVHAEWSALTALVSELLDLPGAAGTSPASDRVLLSLVPSRDAADPVGGVHGPRPGRSEAALADALADLMAAVSFENPLLLVVDDAQWVDDPSRRVLGAALRRLRDDPVMLVRCTRVSDRAMKPVRPDPEPVELWLEPLSRPELAELLLMARFAADPETALGLALRMHRATGGTPLLVVEFLEELRRIGAVDPTGEAPYLDPDRIPERYWDPGTVRELVALRIQRLSPTAGLVCTALARHGRPAPVQALVRATDLGGDAVRRACAEMAEQGIALYDGTSVRFAHDTLLQAARRAGSTGRARRWGVPVAAAAIVLLLVSVVGLVWFQDTPFGGGILLAETKAGWAEVAYDRGDPADWGLRPLPDTLPDPEYSPVPVRVVDGSVRWFGSRPHASGGGPDVVRLGPGDTVVPIVSGPGDIYHPSLNPDGTVLAYKSEDTTAAAYRDFVMAADPDGSGERTLYAAQDIVGLRPWAQDGRSLPVVLPGSGDTLLVLSRTGAEINRFTFELLAGVAWCGSRLAVLVMTDGERSLRLLDPRSGEGRTYEGTAMGPLVCSPDGTHAIHGSANAGVRTLVLRDLASGAVHPLNIDPAIRQLHWVPDAVSPLPVALEATPDSLTLAWGGRATLEAVVRLSSGDLVAPDSLVWGSSDPAVATVTSAGRVVANRPGRAALVAREAPHLVDTVIVRVQGEPPVTAALRETFESLDTARWRVLGEPPAVVTPVGPDGQTALSLTGDEKWKDGIVLRTPVSGSRGLTAELEGRVRLTHPTWQEIRFCLTTVHPDSLDGRTGMPMRPGEPEVCVKYPGAQGPRFDSTAVFLGGWPLPGMHFPIESPGDDWFHMAVQLRPDGRVSAYFNRQFVGAAPVHVTDAMDKAWTVQIFGASVGTETYVREVTLWTEARYPD